MTWFEIPGTELRSVDPAPAPAGYTKNKVIAWNGAALQRKGSVLWMGLSGGHADYAGNEIDRIVLSRDKPAWEEVRPPSRVDFAVDGRNWNATHYEDGAPAARHTYNNQQFIDADERLCWVGAGAIWGTGGRGSEHFDFWDVRGRRFGSYASAQDQIRESLSGPECLVVKHPTTEDIYFSRGDSGRLLKWTHATDTWRLVRSFRTSLSRCCAAIDPRTGVLLRIGHYGSGSKQLRLQAWEADSGESAPGLVNLKGSAAGWFDSTEILKARGAALDWCDPLNAFVYYCGSLAPRHAIVIEPSKWMAEYLPLEGITPDKGVKPHYNRFRFVPELRAFVVVDGWDENVKCFRL